MAWIQNRSAWRDGSLAAVLAITVAATWGIHVWIRSGPFVQLTDVHALDGGMLVALAGTVTLVLSLKASRWKGIRRPLGEADLLICDFLTYFATSVSCVALSAVLVLPFSREDLLVQAIRGLAAVTWFASLGALLSPARLSTPARTIVYLGLAWWIPALLGLHSPILASRESFPATPNGGLTADLSMMLPHLLALGITLLERSRR